MTIDDLAQKIDKLDGHIDTLAIITSKGFEGNTKHHEAFIKRFDILEKDHQDIMMKLSNVAYRFELVALQKRVDFLEKKLGVSHR